MGGCVNDHSQKGHVKIVGPREPNGGEWVSTFFYSHVLHCTPISVQKTDFRHAWE